MKKEETEPWLSVGIPGWPIFEQTLFNEASDTLVIYFRRSADQKDIHRFYVRRSDEKLYSLISDHDDSFEYGNPVNAGDRPHVVFNLGNVRTIPELHPEGKDTIHNARAWWWRGIARLDLEARTMEQILTKTDLVFDVPEMTGWVSQILSASADTLVCLVGVEAPHGTEEVQGGYWVSRIDCQSGKVHRITRLEETFV